MTFELQVSQVDAFTRVPFRGNPAAVCDLRGGPTLSATTMQAIAMEMALSETAFVSDDEGGGTRLRWFTPAAEVKLCGHATIATVHALAETSGQRSFDFETLSGTVSAVREDNGLIHLDFPAAPPVLTPAPSGLLRALGLDVDEVVYSGTNGSDILVVAAPPWSVARCEPDLGAIGRLPVRGVIVSGTADAERFEADFVSRFFAPRVGVPEDPVTGSAHCCLAPYWSQVSGRAALRGYQASARGGYVDTEVRGDRVQLSGHAVTTMRGTLYL